MPNDPKSFLSTDGLQTLIANIKASLGTTDYDDLSDKPKLNNITVQGNKTSTDFGLQDKIDNSHKLNADLIDDSESINKFVTAAEKTAWNKSVSYMSIPNSGDLNDYYGAENAGNYLCTDENVATLSHKPSAITTAFRMDVIFYNNQTIQVIYPNDEKCISFLRIYKNNTWSEWKESAIEMTILSYGNSTWDEFMKAYLLNSIVYCRAGSSTPQTSPQLRLAFMAYVNDEADPTEVEFQYYRSVTNKSDSAQGDEVYVYKLNKTSGWSILKRNAYSKVAVATPITKSYASGTITLSHADSGVTAGTYDSVTVDAQGHVTAGSNYTIDSTPTENSINLVTSGGVYSDQTRQDTVIGIIENKGAKNLLETTKVSQTINGVTFTVNDDGTVTIDTAGVASQDRAQFLLRSVTTYPGMQGYILSGAVQNNQDVQLRFQLGANPWTVYASDSGSGATISSYSDASLIQVYINVPAGSTVSNLVFKPMICTKAEWDISHEYVPYGKTNAELTVENASQQSEINYAINTGVKNLFPYGDLTGITTNFTDEPFSLQAGDYKLSFQISATTGSYAIRVKDASNNSIFYITADNSATTKTYNMTLSANAATITFYSSVSNNFTNIMIRRAEITDPIYEPYARSNPALTAEMDYTVNTGVKNLLDIQRPTTTTRTSYTPLANGGVELSCSNATWTSYAIADIPVEIGKEYIITFLLDESSGTSNFYFFLRNGDSSGTNLATKNYGSTTGNYEASFTPSNSVIWLGIYLNNSATAATATAKLRCMIRDASITDSTYQPYALSNPVITPALIKQVDEGAKNIVQLGFTSTSGSSSVPATTNNNDGTITVNGSRVGAATILVQDLITAKTSSVNTRYTLPAGNYVIAPTGNVNIGLQVYKHDGTNLVGLGNSRLTPLSFTYSDADKVQYPYICIRLYCEGSATINNFTFMPMVCTKDAWDASHKSVPYAPTNRELYEMIGNINTILQGVL